jgi:hypothetical protein
MEIDTSKMNRLVELIKTNPDLLQQVESASDSQSARTILADAIQKNGIDINIADVTDLVKQAAMPRQGVLTNEQLDSINAGSDFDHFLRAFADSMSRAFGGAGALAGEPLARNYLRAVGADDNSKS